MLRQRKRCRREGYNYNLHGAYFITIVVNKRLPLLAEIHNNRLYHTEAGEMVVYWIKALNSKFPRVRVNEWIIMPDHIHLLLTVSRERQEKPSRRDQSVSPQEQSVSPQEQSVSPQEQSVSPQEQSVSLQNQSVSPHLPGYPGNKLQLLPKVMQWFKTMSTNSYIKGVKEKEWPRFQEKLWLESYHDVPIFDPLDFGTIKRYIIRNPEQWLKKITCPTTQHPSSRG